MIKDFIANLKIKKKVFNKIRDYYFSNIKSNFLSFLIMMMIIILTKKDVLKIIVMIINKLSIIKIQ